MNRISLALILFLVTGGLVAQEYNQRDAQGRAQGPWRKYFESMPNQLFYEGQFKDDVRVGTWVYYHKRGHKKAEMLMGDNGKRARATMYSKAGKMIAKGNYVEQKKDSVWTYYFNTGEVNIIEGWLNGVKHGPSITYLRGGGMAEEMTYDQGKREGNFVEYHEKDKKSREGSYENDEYVGKMTFYYESGRKEIEGKYVNAKREGTWLYYNENGSINYQVVYRSGKEIKKKMENGLFTDYSPAGTLLSEITYENGLKEGPFTMYHEVGEKVVERMIDEKTGETVHREVIVGNKPRMKGNYKEDKLHGKIDYFNEMGEPTRSEQYVMGELQ